MTATTVTRGSRTSAAASTGLSIRGLVKIHPGPVCALKGVDLEIPGGMFGLQIGRAHV